MKCSLFPLRLGIERLCAKSPYKMEISLFLSVISKPPSSTAHPSGFLTMPRPLQKASDGKLELLALHDFRVVDPEEIAVENSLDDARDNGNPVDLVLGLGKVPPEPVGDVQAAVDSKGEEVVRGDSLGFAGALEHEELGQDGNGLEPDAEGPEDLIGRVLVWKQDGHCSGAADQILDAEGIEAWVMRGLVL